MIRTPLAATSTTENVTFELSPRASHAATLAYAEYIPRTPANFDVRALRKFFSKVTKCGMRLDHMLIVPTNVTHCINTG